MGKHWLAVNMDNVSFVHTAEAQMDVGAGEMSHWPVVMQAMQKNGGCLRGTGVPNQTPGSRDFDTQRDITRHALRMHADGTGSHSGCATSSDILPKIERIHIEAGHLHHTEAALEKAAHELNAMQKIVRGASRALALLGGVTCGRDSTCDCERCTRRCEAST